MGCKNDNSSSQKIKFDELPKTTIEFKELSHDYGTLKHGEIVSYSFKYKNTGKHPLVIKSVKSDCSCTKFKWNKSPLAPGKSEFVEVIFNSTGESGNIFKTIAIETNTTPQKTEIHYGVLVLFD